MVKELENKIIQAICENDVVYLLQNIDRINIDMKLKSEDNDTLVMYSISDPNSDIYKKIIRKGASLSLLNDLGENILHSAIYSGKLERVIEVVDFVDVNKKSNEGTTPLLLSIGLENENISNYLIEIGADIECSDNDGNKPIHLASYFGLTSVVENLVINRADIFTKTGKGNLPLALAVNQGHKEIIDILYMKMFS